MPVVTHAVTGAGTVNPSWTNPQNAGSDDNVFATCLPNRNNARTSYFALAAFTEIPAGSTINSTTIGFRYALSVTGSDPSCSRALALGTTVTGGTSSATLTQTTTETLLTSTHTLTLAQLQTSTLQLQTIDNRTQSASSTINLDFLYVSVDYTEGGTPAAPAAVRRVGKRR